MVGEQPLRVGQRVLAQPRQLGAPVGADLVDLRCGHRRAGTRGQRHLEALALGDAVGHGEVEGGALVHDLHRVAARLARRARDGHRHRAARVVRTGHPRSRAGQAFLDGLRVLRLLGDLDEDVLERAHGDREVHLEPLALAALLDGGAERL